MSLPPSLRQKEAFVRKREALLEDMANFLLANGLQAFTLRRIGLALQTSDRMLLHYFENKQAILSATLERVLERLLALLEQAELVQTTPQNLIAQMAAMLQTSAVKPFTDLWLELCQGATRQEVSYTQVAQQIGKLYLDWIAQHLALEDSTARRQAAAYVFVVVEGLVVLQAAGLSEHTSAALTWVHAPAIS